MDPVKPSHPATHLPTASETTPTPADARSEIADTVLNATAHAGHRADRAVVLPAPKGRGAALPADSGVPPTPLGWHYLPSEMQRQIIAQAAPATAADLLLTDKRISELTQAQFTQARLRYAIAQCESPQQVMVLFVRPSANDDFGQMRSLNLSAKGLTAGNLAQIMCLCPNLEALDVSNNLLRSDISLILAALPASLSHLNVSYNDLEASGAQAVATSTHLTLASLELGGNDIGSAGLQAVATAPIAATLTHLGLSDNRITAMGARALAASSQLANLQVLELSENNIGDDGLAALARATGLPRLVSLQLHENSIGDAGVRQMVRTRRLAALTELGLGFNRIGNSGAEALAAATGFPALTSIILTNNQIRLRGAEALLQCTHMPALTHVDLSNNTLNSSNKKGLRQIAANRGWLLEL